jgi:nucleoside-diphosphate-sugar epimerase
MWVVRTLLERRYTVRGAVRSVEKGKRVTEYFHLHGDKVEWVIVEDITKVRLIRFWWVPFRYMRQDCAFDEAVKGVDAIIHMATRLPSPVGDLEGMCSCLSGALHDEMCPKSTSSPLCTEP